jgi:UDP-N-acetylglucosamine 2-epimerase (non-hydrolysing)
VIRAPDLEKPRVVVVLGTRPEAIKVFPIIQQLRAEPSLDTRVVVTGQHREMVDDLLRPLGIVPDDDLKMTRSGSSLNELVSNMVPLLDAMIERLKPQMVVVQGDTTTAFCAAMAAFHRQVQVAHVEAGLRSNDRFFPFPEEVNRRMITAVTDLHLAPTQASARNLYKEGVPGDAVVVTGNTAVDSILHVLNGHAGTAPKPLRDGLGRLHVLVTLHRRESWIDADSEGRTTLDRILGGVRAVAQRRPDVDFSYPVHPNPSVKERAERVLSDLPNVKLLPPQPYLDFVHLMASASVILTDSGGIQEEAPSLGIPALVARDVTERPEGIAAGCNRLVGTKAESIEKELLLALSVSRATLGGTLPRPNPYGDGLAAVRIKQAILHRLVNAERPAPFEPEHVLAAAAN